MPKILFCCPTPLTPNLGASKVYIESEEAFRRIGWETRIVGPETVGDRGVGNLKVQATHLRRFLQKETNQFDVIEYEHYALPFHRSNFPSRPLYVARSVLLFHNVYRSRIPPRPTLRSRVANAILGTQRRRQIKRIVQQADFTIAQADLVNLCNHDEFSELICYGHDIRKLLVRPFGLFPERLEAFRPVSGKLPCTPRIAFVGTFDPRKGMGEWPSIVSRILAEHPTARFRLVGTAGMVSNAKGVLSFFPKRYRGGIEVIPHFEPTELPSLLSDCSIGVFPSHCEGFPFGVLEMLAAGLPVVAYRSPGLSMMIPNQNLTSKGDGPALGARTCALLSNPGLLFQARQDARLTAEAFRWEEIAKLTASHYLSVISKRRNHESNYSSC